MSKMDALRAMREERYEQAQKTAQKTAQKSAAKPGATSTRSSQPARRSTPTQRPPVAPPATSVDEGTSAEKVGAEPAEALCGHKNMSGRSCTRPHGHSEKSHRYS